MPLHISSSQELKKELASFSGRFTIQPGSISRLGVHLENHKEEALHWMDLCESMRPFGGILADDKGLGSTCTMICWVLLKQLENGDTSNKNYTGNTLIVCPKAIVTQWVDEIRALAGDQLTVYEYIGTNRETKDISKADIVITTYRIVTFDGKKEPNPLNLKWRRLILDEAQAIRNTKTECSKAIRALNSHFRWAVTGEPIQNNVNDYMALLGFLCG